MITMEYQDWQKSCEMIRNIPKSAKNKYFQTYPFFNLCDSDWDNLLSEFFFNTYIKSGNFLIDIDNLTFPDRVIQKNHGAFRQTKIVSPIIYIFLIAISSQVHRIYREKRSNDISVYYSGNLNNEELNAHYKNSYDNYLVELNSAQINFKYCFQIDFATFFNLIDIDSLFNKLEDLEPKSSLIYSSLIKMIGKGKMPIVDGNSGLSYLNTVVYLDDFDSEVFNNLQSIKKIKDFKLIRYVDDLHLFIDCDEEEIDYLNFKIYHLLHEKAVKHNLEINSSKTKLLLPTSELGKKINNDLYDFYVYGEKIDFDEYFSKEHLNEYLEELIKLPDNSTFSDYENKVLHKLENSELVLDGNFILNSIVYSKENWAQDSMIIKKINYLITNNYRKLYFSTKALITLVLNTKDGNTIKSLLNKLFQKYTLGSADIIDEIIAIEYLVQRKFKHEDLIGVIKQSEENIGNYIQKYQTTNFVDYVKNQKKVFFTTQHEIYNLLNQDTICNYLYFRANYFESLGQVLESFAYYKNYFDRFIAHAMFCTGCDKEKKPNFKLYYKESELKKALKQLNFMADDEIDRIMKEAHKVRNANPVSHSSADLLLNDDLSRNRVKKITNELKEIIVNISNLLQK